MSSRKAGTIDFGLVSGQALEPADLEAWPFFAKRKSNFEDKLKDHFVHRVTGEPIRAAVMREYAPGEMLFEAGHYGSTAFLLVEGTATVFVPEQPVPGSVPGRTKRSIGRLARLFSRRTRGAIDEPGPKGVEEVSRYGVLHRGGPPPPRTVGPGDILGGETCIDFQPRLYSVRAETACKVVEMLRSVFDTVLSSGASGAAVEEHYAVSTAQAALGWQELFSGLSDEQKGRLAAKCGILTQDDLVDGLVYAEGSEPDSLFVVAAGTVKVSCRQPNGERILAYLGRGSLFGVEALANVPTQGRLVLRVSSGPPRDPIVLTGVVTFGRRPSATVAFESSHSSISRRHCRIEERDGELRLFDENSDNGTWQNSKKVQEAILADGDTITLARDYAFVVGREAIAGDTRVRAATATALDSCSIVRIPVADLRAIAPGDARIEGVSADATGAFPVQPAAGSTPDQGFLRKVADLHLYNSQNTLLIDLDRCTRCDECVRACADAHGGIPRFTRDGPRFGRYLVTLACRSCTDPKCMVGCPVGSIRRKDSLEIHIEDWCIGCGLCANNCPFGNINMVDLAAEPRPSESVGPVELTSGALRATVCDLCSGYDGPNCVYACPHDAAIRVNPTEFLSNEDLQST